jgi:RHS repeat-associated protein
MSMATMDTATSTSPVAVYLYAGDQIIENVTVGYFYYQDSLGNTSHVSDSAGNLLERYTYSAFGIPTFFNAAGTQLAGSAYGIRHLFQGQLWTQETGLNDYRNRVELPAMGVFLQPDPIGFKGDAANIYRFCNNNAVNRVDPMGLAPGQPFASAFEAALDVHNFINPTSIRSNHEYGSLIYRLNGHFFATKPLEGTGRESKARTPAPKGATVVGDYHTHGDYSYAVYNRNTKRFEPLIRTDKAHDGWDSDNASPKDMKMFRAAAKNNRDFHGYLCTPSGKMRDYPPQKQESGKSKNERGNDAQTQREPADGPDRGGDMGDAMTAKHIDIQQEATGVPSLGAESTNFVRASRL